MGPSRLAPVTDVAMKSLLGIITMLLVIEGCSQFPHIIIASDPLTADEHLKLGAAYESKKEWDIALEEYSRALKKDPHCLAYFYIGNVWYEKGELSKARENYFKAINLHPNNGDIYNNLAWVYLQENNIEKSLQAIRKALTLNPDNPIYKDTLMRIEQKISPFP